MKHLIGKTGLRALCALAVIAPLAGCGLGTTSIAGSAATTVSGTTPLSSPGGIGGHVHSGLNPVVGAAIQLYSVSTSGYGTAATPLIPTSAQVVYNSSATAGTTGALTASDGSFNISGTYSCPANSYVYITASGGNPGAGINNNLALMAALGSCANLKANAATTSVWINEVTTVAAAYALAQFSGGTNFGTALSAQPGVSGSTAPADNFATSSTNIQGVANAMAIANVLANTSNGTTPGTNLNLSATPEYWTVNTIADILSVCVNDNTGVTGLTLTAPGSGYTSAPTVTISGGGGSGAAATATVDLTPTDAAFGQVTGFTVTAVGVGYTSAPTVTITGGGGSGATATAGIANSSGCSTLFADATPTTGSRPGDTIQVALQMALHPGDSKLLAGTPSGSTLSGLISTTPPFQPYVNTSVTGNTINDWTIGIKYAPTTAAGSGTAVLSNPNYVAIDGYGNAWISNIGGNNGTAVAPSLVELTPTGDPIQAGTSAGVYNIGTYTYNSTVNTLATGPTNTNSIMGVAIDSNNNGWAVDYTGGYIFQVTKSGAAISATGESTTVANGGGGSKATGYYLGAAAAHPTSIAFDASNNAFVELYGASGANSAGADGNASCTSTTDPYTSGTKTVLTLTKASNYGTVFYGNTGGSNQPLLAIDNGTFTFGGVTSVTVTNGGSGYTAPTASFTGGGGSGAAATVVVTGGVITSINLTAAGTGYTSKPTLVITDPTGTGGAATTSITIPGSPFVWTLAEASGGTENHGTSGHYDYMFSYYTQSSQFTGTSPGFTTTMGCQSASGSTSDSNTSATTKINAQGTGSSVVDLFNNAYAVAFDHNNNLWTANPVCVDGNCADIASLTKLTMTFSPPVTSGTPASTANAKIASTSTYSTFTSGGLLSTFPCTGSSCTTSTSPFRPFMLAIDGAGSAWVPNNANATILAAVSNSGVGLAPSTGFTGAIYTPSGGSALQRYTNGAAGVAIDASGNVWITAFTTAAVGPPVVNPANNVTQVVGAAVPVQTPIAAAAAAGNLGNLP